MSASSQGAGQSWKESAEEGSADGDGAVEGAEVLARLAARDAGAMVDLHQSFGTPLFSFALRILSDRSDAEEALQDALVRIWDRAGEFDLRRGRPFTWCCLIVRGCCIDRLRRSRALKRGGGKIIHLSQEILEETVAGVGNDVRGQTIWREQIREVRQALKGLHPEERRYIEEAVFKGKTHHEISDEAGEPLGTVKSRIRRGLIKLRKTLRSKKHRTT